VETLVQTDVWAVKIIRLAIGIVIGILALLFGAIGGCFMIAYSLLADLAKWVAE